MIGSNCVSAQGTVYTLISTSHVMRETEDPKHVVIYEVASWSSHIFPVCLVIYWLTHWVWCGTFSACDYKRPTYDRKISWGSPLNFGLLLWSFLHPHTNIILCGHVCKYVYIWGKIYIYIYVFYLLKKFISKYYPFTNRYIIFSYTLYNTP